jgi:hypothetical protein
LVTFIAVAVAVGVVFWQFDPRLLFANTTITGGDTGSHVATAAFLRTLIEHGHLTGWDPQWYDGFPLYTFYFPLADAIAAVASWIIPFNIAFKLATVLGSLTLPVAAWAFGRLAGLERPRPAVLAVATLPFLFDQTFTIYGGNLYSTMAGEYAYSLGLSIALVFLGLVLRGLRTHRHRGLSAVVLALCALAHLVAVMFAVAGALIAWLLVWPTRRRTWWMVSTLGIAGLLVSFWALPFIVEQAYSTNMGWLNVTTYASMLAPRADWWALGLASIGFIISIWRPRVSQAIQLLTVLGGAAAAAVVLDPQGKLYNTRFLPLWWLCVYLVAGLGFAEICVILSEAGRALWRRLATTGSHDPLGNAPGRYRWAPGAVVVPLLGVVASLGVILPPLVPELGSAIGVQASSVSSWVKWNYSGYQGKPSWPEYQALMSTMGTVGKKYGCGQSMWEYNADENRFGTPEALMLLPYWTNDCIGSMEGLLFESASTTPYHFLNQAELSASPSEAMVGLPYAGLNVALGVEHLQMLGVRYFLAFSPEVVAAANADPSLTKVASTGPWTAGSGSNATETTWEIYLVHDAVPVAPLVDQPAVLQGVGPSQTSWLPTAVAWYDNPAEWSTELVADGPPSWQRVRSGTTPLARALLPVTVSAIVVGRDTVSFHVNRTGVPVVVRTSYFPAWHAAGATGPYRAEPNLMVVVPTAHNVELSYGSTPSGNAGMTLTILGVIALAASLRRRSRLIVP